MALARKQHNVAGLGHFHRGVNRLAAVRDAGVGRAGGHVARNVANDVLGRLVVGVVAGDDRIVGVGARCVGQLLAAHLGAATHRPKYAKQAVRVVRTQCFQRTGQGQPVVAVVHNEGAPGQTLDDFKAALHGGVGQRGGGLGGRHAERAAQCDGTQRIGRAERTGGHDLNVGRSARVYAVKVNAEGGLAAVLCQILPVIVGGILDAKADLLALKALAHEIAVGVIYVVNHRAGVVFCKQTALGALVILKVWVLAGADVILRQVREGHDLKRHAVHAVVAQRLAADLQYAVAHARIQHLAEQPVQLETLGRRVGGGLVHARNVDAVGADVGAGQTGLGHDGRGQQGGGRLALRACNADEMQLVGGVAVEIRTDDGQRRAGVVGDDLHGVRGQVDPMLHQKGAAAVLVGTFGVGMSIQPRTDKADKQRAGASPAGVVGDGGDVRIGGTGVGDMLDKVV